MAFATALCATLAAATLGAAPPAEAVPGRTGHGIEVPHVLATGTTWLGPVAGPAGTADSPWYFWCISAGLAAPNGAPATVAGAVHDPLLAWAVGTYEPAARTDASGLTSAALSYLQHVRHETGTPAVTAAERVAAFEARTPQAIKDRAAQMLAEAATQAGPYTGSAASADTADRRTGALNGIGVRSAAGAWVAGLPATVTLDGPAVFDLDRDGTAGPGESATWTGRTAAAPLSLPWVATGNGTVTWRVAFDEVGRTTLTRFTSAAQVQDTLTYGHRDPSDPPLVETPGPPFEVVRDFQPVAASHVGDAKVVEVGEPLADTLTVAAAEGDEWIALDGDPVDVTFEGTAYSTGTVPAAASAAVPEGARPVATASFVADGPGTYAVTADGVHDGQMVTWVWRVVKDHQRPDLREYVRGDWSDGHGLADETTSVRWPAPEVDTTLTVRETKSGTYLVDDVWTTGFPDDHPGFEGGAGFAPDVDVLTHELWFFPSGTEVTDANLDAAELVGTVALDAANGFDPTVGSTSYRVRKDADGRDVPGTYAARVVFPGDDRVAAFTTSVSDPAEQYVVAPEPLGLATVARSDGELVAGGTAVLHDVATVTGAVPPGATIEFDLYRWAGPEPVCTPDTVVARDPAAPLAGPGEHLSAETRVAALSAGSYGYVATVRGASGQVLARGACGEEPETLHVSAAPEPPAAAPVVPTPLARTGTGLIPGALAAAALAGGGVLLAVRHRARRAGA